MGGETREEAERRPGRRLHRRSPFQKGGKNGFGWRWEAGERGSLEAGGGPWGAPGTASPGPVFGVSSSWLTLVTAPDREGGQTARRP